MPDGQRIITVSDQEIIKIWKTSKPFESETIEEGIPGVERVLVTGDAMLLVIIFETGQIITRNLIDNSYGNVINQPPASRFYRLQDVKLSADGTKLATIFPEYLSSGEDGGNAFSMHMATKTEIWRLSEGRRLSLLKVDEGLKPETSLVEFFPSGTHAITASWDTMLRV